MVPSPAFPPIELSALAEAVAEATIRGERATSIVDLAFDTREALPGCLFFCVRGSNVDGHQLAGHAVAAGAAALVVERWLEVDRPQVLVPSVRTAMGPMSSAAFGNPAGAMSMVGVTGTNGKTTTTYLLEAIGWADGRRPGVVGTTGARVAGEPVALARTTPEAPDLHRLLARMRDAGVDVVAMEVSSHALDQDRVGGVVFDVAAFTNLSRDHLDYHTSMEDYFDAKARLFDPARARCGVVNGGDPWGRRLLEHPTIPMTSYLVAADGDGTGADRTGDVDAPALVAQDVEVSRTGVAFGIGEVRVRSQLRGRFNVANCVGAVAIARALGIDDAVAAEGIATVEGVPGRVELVEEGQNFLVVVDYAHTPDSIQHVLQAARPLTSGRLIIVFGCGGDRDRAKRPLMGEAAASNADLTVITSDNPRSEDPLAIIGQIEPGARRGIDRSGGRYIVEPDRRTAIGLALAEAGEGDTVVIAGKGHEPYQELASGMVPFDDRDVARELLSVLGAGA